MEDGKRTPAREHERLDSTAFWKQAYETSEAAQAELLDRIYELEQSQNLPQNRREVFDIPASPIAGNTRKRKNDTTAKANSQSKRRTVIRKMPLPREAVTEKSTGHENATEVDEFDIGMVEIDRLYRFGS